MTRLAERVFAAIQKLAPCSFGDVYGHMAEVNKEDRAHVRAALLELWDLGHISVGSDRALRTVE